MSDAYSTPTEPIDEEAGEPTAVMAGPAEKQPQQAVNYRAGTPLKNCGLCEHFEGVPGKAPDGCESVDGTISPFGYCDIYLKQPNPFGDTHQYTMSGDTITPAGPPAAAPTTIGNKTYA